MESYCQRVYVRKSEKNPVTEHEATRKRPHIFYHPGKVVTECSCADEWFFFAVLLAMQNHSSAHERSVTT